MSSRNNHIPPTATAVTVDNGDEASSSLIQAIPVRAAAASTSSASPSEYFEYSKERLYEDELLTSAVAADNSNIPLAPTLTGYEDSSPAAQAIATSAKTRLGSDIGRVNAIEEKERIRAISRLAQSKPYHEKARIEAAGTVARERVRQGFDAQEEQNSPTVSSKMKKEVEKQDAAFVKKGGGYGYEVSDYETKEYSCNTYNTSGYEYKSVYD